MQESIRRDLSREYDLSAARITPVSGGYLNRKWRVTAEGFDLLVKWYSPERFTRPGLERIEAALQRQIRLYEGGVPCPELIPREGRVIRWLEDDTAYMVMAFCPGSVLSPAEVGVSHMRGLGDACARMHAGLGRLPAPGEPRLPGFGGYSMDAVWRNFEARMDSLAYAADSGAAECRAALGAAEPVLRSLPADFFARFQRGYAHEDFQPGNLLFGGEGLSAILDFDRCAYSFPLRDVGRAILSFALEPEGLNRAKVYAFVEGYSRHLPLTIPQVVDALRLAGCIEIEWWIQPEFFGDCDAMPARFRDEVLWLVGEWFGLEAILGGQRGGHC